MFQQNLTTNFATSTLETRSKPARRERTRLRAKDLTDAKLREVKRAFDIQRNTLEVAQNHLMPRSEAVDGVLIRMSDDLRSFQQELIQMRRQMGIADVSGGRPFLVRSAA